MSLSCLFYNAAYYYPSLALYLRDHITEKLFACVWARDIGDQELMKMAAIKAGWEDNYEDDDYYDEDGYPSGYQLEWWIRCLTSAVFDD